MALTQSKRLCLSLNKGVKKNVLALGSKFQLILPAVFYCNSTDISKLKMKKTVQKYLEEVAKSDEFMKQQLQQFELGKEFLAGMMGRKSKEMTQEDIDAAIEYLFPSALFVPKARPLMKPPEELFSNQKIIEYDRTGRPHHYLFYTLKPNFSQCLHDAAEVLEKLNGLLYKNKTPSKPLSMTGGNWFTQEELSKKFSEKIYDIEYEKFLEIFNKLREHPLATHAEDFIRNYWKVIEKKVEVSMSPNVVRNDNMTVATIEG